ncbi:MAG TPA: hypothetical protein VH349_00840 [Ktedonobacterales bacterium]
MDTILNALLPYVNAIAAVIGAGTVVLATLYAVRQYKDGVKARYLDGLYHVYELLSGDQARTDRDAVYALPDLVDTTRPTFATELALVRKVTARYDFVGHLVMSGILPAEYVVPVYFDQVIRVWEKTLPYITYIQRDRRLGEAFHKRFRDLYQRCKRYQGSHSEEAIDIGLQGRSA